MKRFMLIAVLAGVLVTLLAGTALAAGPVTPPAQGFGRGMGMWGANGAASTAEHPCGMAAGAQRRGMPEWAGQPDEVATLLGMTAEEIQAERQAGKSLAQIAASKNPPVSEDKLISTILDAKKATLADLVAAGKLTQAQADLMVEHMQTQVKTMVERTSVGPMMGQGRGQMRPGMGQGFRGGGRWATR